MVKARDIGLLRLIAQRVAGPGSATAADAVRWMTATQAQDYASAVLAIALRTQSRSRGEVHAALDNGSVVRSWPMRGTLHFVAAEDLSWMLALTAERSLATSEKYRAHLGLEWSTVERAREVAIETLSGGGGVSRADLLASWEKAGLQNVKEHGYRLIWHLAQTRTLCLGPTGPGPTSEQHFVLFDEWITKPRHLERDEALGEWALRYFRSHGPATAKDFTWWTQLKAADVRTAVAIAAPQLECIVVDDVTYYLNPQTLASLAPLRAKAREVFLLPGFDEYLLGYQTRTAVLPADFASRIVPGGNGVFLPTVISDGEVVGTWKRTGTGTKRALTAVAFTAFDERVRGAIERVYSVLPVG
ncbi:MAG TPA: winged helix DNA-binding domain-containing protein [Acidothermaceae bacterium]